MTTNAASPSEPICEFTNPCTTANTSTETNESANPRKVISHIFGRNKTATKLFPPQVWVHYCRKHYQRARYRSKEWPFTQCDLLLDSLDRMEAWEGVRCFKVVLRRREVERRVDTPPSPAPATASATASASASGHRGDGDKDRTVGDGGEGALPSPVNSDSEGADTGGNAGKDDEDADYGCRRASSQGKKGAQSKRRKPIIAPAPVPAWLRQEVGPQKSFDEVRGIVQRLRDYLARLQDEGRVDEIRFPDIEILPSFEKWVLDGAAARKKQPRRVGQGL